MPPHTSSGGNEDRNERENPDILTIETFYNEPIETNEDIIRAYDKYLEFKRKSGVRVHQIKDEEKEDILEKLKNAKRMSDLKKIRQYEDDPDAIQLSRREKIVFKGLKEDFRVKLSGMSKERAKYYLDECKYNLYIKMLRYGYDLCPIKLEMLDDNEFAEVVDFIISGKGNYPTEKLKELEHSNSLISLPPNRDLAEVRHWAVERVSASIEVNTPAVTNGHIIGSDGNPYKIKEYAFPEVTYENMHTGGVDFFVASILIDRRCAYERNEPIDNEAIMAKWSNVFGMYQKDPEGAMKVAGEYLVAIKKIEETVPAVRTLGMNCPFNNKSSGEEVPKDSLEDSCYDENEKRHLNHIRENLKKDKQVVDTYFSGDYKCAEDFAMISPYVADLTRVDALLLPFGESKKLHDKIVDDIFRNSKDCVTSTCGKYKLVHYDDVRHPFHKVISNRCEELKIPLKNYAGYIQRKYFAKLKKKERGGNEK